MPPTTTIASGFWACEPIEWPGRREQAQDGRERGHDDRAEPQLRPADHGLADGSPVARIWLKYEIRSTPFWTATPKIEMNPTAAEMLKVRAGQLQGPDAPHRRRARRRPSRGGRPSSS